MWKQNWADASNVVVYLIYPWIVSVIGRNLQSWKIFIMYCTINNPLYAWSSAKNVAMSICNPKNLFSIQAFNAAP